MAKTRQRTFAPLPLGDTFYARLSHTAEKVGLAKLDEAGLARAVAAVSRAYTRDRAELDLQATQREAHTARAHFFLPRDLVKVLGPVRDLARLGLLPAARTLRVLDVGAGLGSSTLGLSRGLAELGTGQRLEVLALERDAGALAFFRGLSRELGAQPEFAPFSLEARDMDVTTKLPEGKFDVVLLGFVLNELYPSEPEDARVEKRAALLEMLRAKLTADGVIIVLEPALKDVTRTLMKVRDALSTHVLLPCVRTGPCPMLTGERDWCHEELRYALPPHLAKVARAAGLRFEGLSYAALVLGAKGRATTRDSVVRIVSERLESKGKLELMGCGQPGLTRFSLLSRDESEANRAFGSAERGHELLFDVSAARLTALTRVEKA